MTTPLPKKISIAILLALSVGMHAPANANVTMAQSPLFLPGTVPPLNLIVMGRDHKLYYEAYNDASDLDGDGVPDVGYKPSITYFGLFDSNKCYSYSDGIFSPTSTTTNKKCTSAWSGDFLNYLTTSRVDALRKVLYGGTRSTDTATSTILERSHIPQDAHSWGKEYHSEAVDGYLISDYTPLTTPVSGTRHLFANTTLRVDSPSGIPLLRVATNSSQRIWSWVSKERPVAGGSYSDGTTVDANNYTVRVEVCKASLPETNCKLYGSSLKPVGLLQDFGENDSMLFGLLTGSYQKNTAGGVLRRTIGSIKDEINADGTFKSSITGVIRSIDLFRTVGFDTGYTHSANCGWITTRPINDGECRMWGNPIGEMMYEGLRYFMGKNSPTSAYSINTSGNDDADLGLSVATWNKPLEVYPWCSAPVQLVISDVNPSYDSDQLPGSAFSSFTGDVSGLNVSSLGAAIWNNEYGASALHYIGQSGDVSDGAPTAKTVSSFGNIRGLSPEEPTKLGSYYSASVAYFGKTNSLVSGKKNFMTTYAVALASPLPRIEIPVAGKIVTLVPFAKSVSGSSISSAAGEFQPVNQIVDFYIETIANMQSGSIDASINGGRPYGKFRINFEDVEQGADHDMDAVSIYEFAVKADNTVDITMISDYAAGGIEQHMGYVISGTSKDGIYLEVRDKDTGESNTTKFYLGTPPGAWAGDCAKGDDKPAACNTALPLVTTRNFSVGTGSAATLLKDPLWYAAKYGGFDTKNNTVTMPTATAQWDGSGDGNPDNYFLVTNALTLKEQLQTAFTNILTTPSSSSSSATNSTRLNDDTAVYQARFLPDDWTGQLLSYKINADGTIGALNWDASLELPAHGSRKIFTRTETGSAIPFKWADLSTTLKGYLSVSPTLANTTAAETGELRLNWLRGDASYEDKDKTGAKPFRARKSGLGDMVNSDPVYVYIPNFAYEYLPEGTAGRNTYTSFRNSQIGRPKMIYVGANDGMLHGFNATTGVEEFAYIPRAVLPELHKLPNPTYTHQYFVDGSPYVADAFFAKAGETAASWKTVLVGTAGAGAKSIFALDVTNPGNFGTGDILWDEKNITSSDAAQTAAAAANLGYNLGQARIARLNNGTWAAIFGNGFGSSSNKSVLYIVNVATGALIKQIETGTTGQGTAAWPAGLSTPTLVDANADRTVDYVYAGDLKGNVWKFDLTGTNTNNWDVAYKSGSTPVPVFAGTSTPIQPITAEVTVSVHPKGGYMLHFGTGKYFETSDNVVPASPPVMSFYGIRDPGGNNSPGFTRTSSDLQLQSIIAEGSLVTDSAISWRVVSQNAVTYANNGKQGWRLDLASPPNATAKGERVVSAARLRDDRIIFATLIPSTDPCSAGGTSFLMELDALSGGRFDYSVFDVNKDGFFDANDYVTIVEGGVTKQVPVSGKGTQEGIIKTPAIITAGKVEYKFASGSGGGIERIVEKGGVAFNRRSWRELR